MRKQTYEEAFDAAQADLANLLDQRAELDKQIAQMRQTLGALAQLLGRDAKPKEKGLDLFDFSLTRSVLDVLAAANKPLKPVEVKKGLLRKGLDIKPYHNFMSSLHKILQRLEVDDEIDHVGEGRDKAYKIKLKFN